MVATHVRAEQWLDPWLAPAVLATALGDLDRVPNDAWHRPSRESVSRGQIEAFRAARPDVTLISE